MKNKILVLILFGVMLVGGWYSRLSSISEKENIYREYVAAGDEKYEKTLYQEAGQYYQAALEMKQTRNVEEKLVAAYEGHYSDEPSYTTQDELLDVLQGACENYSEVAEFWERRIELYLEECDYKNALKVCEQAYEEGVDSEHYVELFKEVKYAHEEETLYQVDYRENVNGYFLLNTGLEWKWITDDGEEDSDIGYSQIGYINKDGIFLCTDKEKKTYFVDMDGVKRGIINLDVTDFGVLSSGYCGVKYQDAYALIDIDGNILIDGLVSGGCFQNGYAPVEKEKGDWYLVDTEGQLHETDMDEIVTDYVGRYLINDTVLVKKDGKYHIYNAELTEAVSDFSCKDIDILTEDGITAYQDDDGKWGFVNLDGTIFIEPQYDEAKSFSNGLAAVCKDGKWGIINNNNELIIDYQYTYCGYLSSGGVVYVKGEDEDYYKTIKFEFPDLIA